MNMAEREQNLSTFRSQGIKIRKLKYIQKFRKGRFQCVRWIYVNSRHNLLFLLHFVFSPVRYLPQ